MARERRTPTRRPRSLTTRIVGVTAVVFVAFLAVATTYVDALDRGGPAALFLLFSGLAVVAALLASFVARGHARTIATLIDRGAHPDTYPRDASAIARSVAGLAEGSGYRLPPSEHQPEPEYDATQVPVEGFAEDPAFWESTPQTREGEESFWLPDEQPGQPDATYEQPVAFRPPQPEAQQGRNIWAVDDPAIWDREPRAVDPTVSNAVEAGEEAPQRSDVSPSTRRLDEIVAELRRLTERHTTD